MQLLLDEQRATAMTAPLDPVAFAEALEQIKQYIGYNDNDYQGEAHHE